MKSKLATLCLAMALVGCNEEQSSTNNSPEQADYTTKPSTAELEPVVALAPGVMAEQSRDFKTRMEVFHIMYREIADPNTATPDNLTQDEKISREAVRQLYEITQQQRQRAIEFTQLIANGKVEVRGKNTMTKQYNAFLKEKYGTSIEQMKNDLANATIKVEVIFGIVFSE